MEPIKYFAMESCSGEFFACSRLSATLSSASCAGMWRHANLEKESYRHEKCKGCQIGAFHAGEKEMSSSKLMGKKICARCHKLSRRFVRNDICISCYNRQQEWVKGRNARGTTPIKQKPLYPGNVPYLVAGKEMHIAKVDLVESTVELVTKILRDNRKEVMFGFFTRAIVDGSRKMVAD